jgi:ferredoxin
MVGIYFSGTGNTRYCVKRFCDGTAYSIEDPAVAERIAEDNVIVLGYPVYYSDMPLIMRDFLKEHSSQFSGKNVFILCTQALFSGDGAGAASRLLTPFGANITGGLHIEMPDVIADNKLLKKTEDEKAAIIEKANAKIDNAILSLRYGNPPQDGLGTASRALGLVSQRLWNKKIISKYADNLKVSKYRCVGCGICIRNCPMKNLSLKDGVTVSSDRCTRCYRCVNLCPKRAITLLGDDVYAQKKVELDNLFPEPIPLD